MDFSFVDIRKTKINNAGNDCVDVSGGTYQMSKVTAAGVRIKESLLASSQSLVLQIYTY